jgi:pilus assembly protein CpaB
VSAKRSLVVAAALGVAGGAAAWAAVRTRQDELRDAWRTVRVLCAARDLPEGTELQRDLLAVRELPARFVTPSYLRVASEAMGDDMPIGRRLLGALKAGDPLLAGQLGPPRDPGLSSKIAPRARAVAIDVQERSAVGLWVRAGDRVDVVGSLRDPDSQQLKTVALLQNVEVLATGRADPGAPDDGRYSTVTLLAAPDEAEMLALAQETGTVTLLLRNPDDSEVQDRRAALDQRQLLAGRREVDEKRSRAIHIIRGTPGSTRAAAREE